MIPMIDPIRLHRPIQRELEEAALRVIRSGKYILGSEVESFEENCCKYLNCSYALACSSGTDALLLSLMLHIKNGKEVLVPALSFGATASVVERLGLHLQFIDIDPTTFCMNPKLIEKQISSETNAIMPVNLFGQIANIEEIAKIKAKINQQAILIEDACQSFGALIPNNRNLSDLQCYSFYPTKNLGGFGEGGLVTTNNKDLYESLKCYRNCGIGTQPYIYQFTNGGNFRMDAIQAALLNVKLKYLPQYETLRAAHAALYKQMLSNIELYILPETTRGKHVWNQYTIRVLNGRRDACKDFLTKKGISSTIYYPSPLNKQFSSVHIQSCPEAEKACSEVLSLPIAAEIRTDEIEQVANTLIEFSKI